LTFLDGANDVTSVWVSGRGIAHAWLDDEVVTEYFLKWLRG
jgi:hypothetical protein